MLELKSADREKIEQKQRELLIVPCWNWNLPVRQAPGPLSSFNRTMLELKCINLRPIKCYYILLIVPCWNWNYVFRPKTIVQTSLLIVPCWNWNFPLLRRGEASLITFNRTMLELKFLKSFWKWRHRKTFNRTMLELKSCSYAWGGNPRSPFNRTMLELKLP